MKKLLVSFIFLALSTACGDKPAEQPVPSRFANTSDFICGMPVNNEATDTLVYNGKTYAFCSSGCRDQFAKNPDYYLSITE